MRVYVKLLLFLATVIDILSHSHIYSLCPFYYTAFFFFCKWYRPILHILNHQKNKLHQQSVSQS